MPGSKIVAGYISTFFLKKSSRQQLVPSVGPISIESIHRSYLYAPHAEKIAASKRRTIFPSIISPSILHHHPATRHILLEAGIARSFAILPPACNPLLVLSASPVNPSIRSMREQDGLQLVKGRLGRR